jgi:AcrR family transcriptional regulator
LYDCVIRLYDDVMGDTRENPINAADGRQRLTEALIRVVARDGFAGVSVRSVAAEAGVSGGTVQYHFPTRAQMIRSAMEQVSLAVEERLTRAPDREDIRTWTRDLLLDLLPLDTERSREHAVWLAFIAHARTDPALTQLKRRTNARLHELYVRIVRARRALPAPEGVSAEIDPELEDSAVLLQSMLDGLSLHLADLGPDEAMRIGPPLLDRCLTAAVDVPPDSEHA